MATKKTTKKQTGILAKDLIAACQTSKKEQTATLKFGEGESAVSVTVKRRLSLQERGKMIKDIVSMVFIADENGREEYCPYVLEFAFGFYTLVYYTNIVPPTAVVDTEKLLEAVDIVQEILNKVTDTDLADVIGDTHRLIDYKKNVLANQSPLSTILTGISGLVGDLREKLGDMDGGEMMELIKANFPALNDDINKVLQEQAAQPDAAK